MNIVVTEDLSGFAPRDCRFTAVDEDVWDGAEDSRNRGMVGYGASPEEAIADWHRLLEEWALWEGDEP